MLRAFVAREVVIGQSLGITPSNNPLLKHRR